MQYKDYYAIMGVARDASQDEIKQAYRKLARKYHPDRSEQANAEQRFKELGEAYEVLKDPEKRRAYDMLGANYRPGQEFHPPPDWDQMFSGGGAGAGAGDFSDFFRSLFESGGFGARPGPQGPAGGFGGRRDPFMGQGRGQFTRRGSDNTLRITIDVEDAYLGATRQLALRQPGGGERTLSVRIPKGIRAGQQIRLAGQGAPGVGGGRDGDLLLEVQFREHVRYRVDGRDVSVDVPVAPWVAALGGTAQVSTPTGTLDLRIPPGSAPDRRLRLRGRGLPAATPGDLYAVLKVQLPPANTAAERTAWETFRDSFDAPDQD